MEIDLPKAEKLAIETINKSKKCKKKKKLSKRHVVHHEAKKIILKLNLIKGKKGKSRDGIAFRDELFIQRLKTLSFSFFGWRLNCLYWMVIKL